MAIFAEVTENECINERHTLVNGDNLTNTARQGCSLGLERLGLETVSRRFLERLASSRS